MIVLVAVWPLANVPSPNSHMYETGIVRLSKPGRVARSVTGICSNASAGSISTSMTLRLAPLPVADVTLPTPSTTWITSESSGMMPVK